MKEDSGPQYFGADWICPVDQPPLADGFLAIENGRILGLGRMIELPEAIQPEVRSHASGVLITPGLVNAHTHLELSFPESIPVEPGQSMGDWLRGVIRAANSPNPEMTPEAARLSRCQTGVAESLAAGVTCVNDISSDGASLSVLDAAGLRGTVSLEFFHPGWETLRVEPIIERYRQVAERYAEHPLLRVGLSPHSPYNVSPAAWQAVISACDPPVVHSHLAESQDEIEWLAQTRRDGLRLKLDQLHQAVLQRTFEPQWVGLTPVGYLEQFQLLESRLIMAHGVYTTEADRALMKKHGVSLAHCPRSNLFLQQQTLDWFEWRESGIAIGLGTDSRLSNHSLDLREEARESMALHGWTAETSLRHLTLEGARAMALESNIGSLSVGKAADFVIWNTASVSEEPDAASLFLAPQTALQEVYIEGQGVIRKTNAIPKISL